MNARLDGRVTMATCAVQFSLVRRSRTLLYTYDGDEQSGTRERPDKTVVNL